MPSLARGESSSDSNPVLDIWTAIGNPPGLVDVIELSFRILDISTPAKRVTPVQVYPASIGTFQVLDPTTAPPTGHRLAQGHYFAPWTVPLDEAIGDHRIEWQFKLNELTPTETMREEFFVTASLLPTAATYCGVGDIRAEGFTDPPFTDARIQTLAMLATRYIDKMTGRWFSPREFTTSNPMLLDGRGGYELNLQIPIIRLDKLEIDYVDVGGRQFEEISLENFRVYNRHLSGMTEPDDRENPRISFAKYDRFYQVPYTCDFHRRKFANGSQNVRIEGVFGYTDPDGSPFGETPLLIRQAACRLITRDLYLDSELCKKLGMKNKYRITSDKEGSTTIKLQDLWLKGAFTGDSEIDNILMAYKRPARIGIA